MAADEDDGGDDQLSEGTGHGELSVVSCQSSVVGYRHGTVSWQGSLYRELTTAN
jgi:hypothetical protein